MLDLAIIGAGPAGLSAGLVAHTNGLHVMVLERSGVAGGQILRADHDVGDVLGQPASDGATLAAKLFAHFSAVGAPITFGADVDRVVQDGTSFALGSLRARAVIIATGTRARRLGITGEEIEVPLRHVAASLAGSRVVIVGGGDEACSTATVLSSSGVLVTLVVRVDLRARPQFRDPVLADPRIDILRNESVLRIADGVVELASGAIVPALHCYTRIGVETATPTLEPDPERLADGRLWVDAGQRTRLSGLYAAGDAVLGAKARYVSTAIAQGVIAARSVEEDRA